MALTPRAQQLVCHSYASSVVRSPAATASKPDAMGIVDGLASLLRATRQKMRHTTAAIVLGGSGSVGQALVASLIRSASFHPVVTLVRRAQPEHAQLARDANVELREVIVASMDTELTSATLKAVQALAGDAVGLSTLGVGGGTAKLTLQQHRAVDVDLNAAFARALRTSGRVKHLALMSAVGADPRASPTGSGAAGLARYARVKGECEAAARAEGPAIVSVFRPAMIIGSKHTPRMLEALVPLFSFVTPAKYRSITVQQIADAMVAAAVHTPPTSKTYHFSEMVQLASLLASRRADNMSDRRPSPS